jgi:two-component system response regulator HydG
MRKRKKAGKYTSFLFYFEPSMAAILVIEDDLTFSRILVGFLQKQGFDVQACHKGAEGVALFTTSSFDIVLLDYRLPDMTGLDVLAVVKQARPTTQVIMMTGFSDIRTAVKAMQMGALEYITKPVNPDELLMIVNQALKPGEKKGAVPAAQATPQGKYVEGTSALARQLFEHLRLVAPTDMSVIIQGESGTGKENVARTIHRLSKRSSAKFVAVDCGALSRDLSASELFGHVKGAFTGAVTDKVGQFEEAHNGTLFLDEVGNLSIDVQMKLLRALQERVIHKVGSTREIKVDVRILTATNDDLVKSVQAGNFREDLYHRLNEFKVDVPPLRERADDWDEFLTYFRESANVELSRHTVRFSEEVMTIFRAYDWPGNLREMKNVVRRAVLLTREDVVQAESLPSEMLKINGSPRVSPQPDNTALVYDLKILQESQEKEIILKTLNEVRFNKSKAARILNIDRKTLYLKMEKYGIT